MKTPEMEKALRELFPSRANMDVGKCVTCGNPITKFRNELSEREYKISGMCQDCQDSVFGS